MKSPNFNHSIFSIKIDSFDQYVKSLLLLDLEIKDIDKQ